MKGYFLLVILLLVGSLHAQRVTVGKEINVRNDYAYDIIGKVSDHIVLFRDKGDDF